jgi:hypothetical protein
MEFSIICHPPSPGPDELSSFYCIFKLNSLRPGFWQHFIWARIHQRQLKLTVG